MTQFQGRKVQSQIGHRSKPSTFKAKEDNKNVKRYEKKNQSNIAMAPAFEKRHGKKLRPKGNGKNVPTSRKTWCEFCAKHITDVSQHNRSETHEGKRKLNIRWKFCTECETAWQEQQLHVCVPARGSQVERTKMWYCATCNQSIPADPQSVRDHESSQEHLRMKNYDANVSRLDGAALASNQRKRNDTAAAKTDQPPKKRKTADHDQQQPHAAAQADISKTNQKTTAPAGCGAIDARVVPVASLGQAAAGGKNCDVCLACGVHCLSMLVTCLLMLFMQVVVPNVVAPN